MTESTTKPASFDQLSRANARRIRKALRRVLRAAELLTSPAFTGYPPPLRPGSREVRQLNEVALALEVYAEEAAAGSGRAAEAMIGDALTEPLSAPQSEGPETVRLPSKPPPAANPFELVVDLTERPIAEPYRDSELPPVVPYPAGGPAHPFDMGPGQNQDGSPSPSPEPEPEPDLDAPPSLASAFEPAAAMVSEGAPPSASVD